VRAAGDGVGGIDTSADDPTLSVEHMSILVIHAPSPMYIKASDGEANHGTLAGLVADVLQPFPSIVPGVQ
jgi:hypothetical protein